VEGGAHIGVRGVREERAAAADWRLAMGRITACARAHACEARCGGSFEGNVREVRCAAQRCAACGRACGRGVGYHAASLVRSRSIAQGELRKANYARRITRAEAREPKHARRTTRGEPRENHAG